MPNAVSASAAPTHAAVGFWAELQQSAQQPLDSAASTLLISVG
jgi:hypothetical protein